MKHAVNEETKRRIITVLKVKSHSINTLQRDISYISKEELLVALDELIVEKKVSLQPKDPTNNQSEDRYYYVIGSDD